MTRVSLTRQSAVVLVGVGVLLVAGAVGWGAISTGSTGAGTPSAAGDEPAERQNETNGNESVITANQTVEAFRAVENRTNGTVFGARLRGEVGGDLNQSTFVYQLDVLAENGSHLVAEVHAANATVASVESANDSDGLFADLFGSSDEVPDEARNASELRSATDAVRLAVNETDAAEANRTVTKVVLETRNGTLVYRVQQFDPSGEPQELIVAATRGEGGVITTDPQDSREVPAAVRTSG